ncbi:MAG: ATP-binding protein [Myxococcales bacterium]|nr:ATP-binding protein [Myxococcales bacterium]
MPPIQFGHRTCSCSTSIHRPLFIALTGGPGGGKTAVLEIAERIFCKHVAVLPEAASIVFSGGFPRHDTLHGRKAAQRAIYHVQSELEHLMRDEDEVAVVLCDRGTVDGIAYWPDSATSYWEALGTTRDAELARYDAVVHLETPDAAHGYNRENELRIETALTAHAIDERIALAWEGHKHRVRIGSSDRFLDKAQESIAAIGDLMPKCCS